MSKQTVGWFVEIPRSLREEFDLKYPGKRNKKILTITAIQRALKVAPKSLYNLYRETTDGMGAAKVDVSGSGTDVAGGEEELADDRERERQSVPVDLIGQFRASRSGQDRKSRAGD